MVVSCCVLANHRLLAKRIDETVRHVSAIVVSRLRDEKLSRRWGTERDSSWSHSPRSQKRRGSPGSWARGVTGLPPSLHDPSDEELHPTNKGPFVGTLSCRCGPRTWGTSAWGIWGLLKRSGSRRHFPLLGNGANPFASNDQRARTSGERRGCTRDSSTLESLQ